MINCVLCSLVVHPDKSWRYCAFVIVTPLPPLQRFLVCALHPRVLIQPFSFSGCISLVPRSRCQSILGALRFHLWLPGGQMCFSCRHSIETWVFNQLSSYWHQIWVGPRSECQSIFGALWFHLWPLGSRICLFLVCTVNPQVFNWSFQSCIQMAHGTGSVESQI